MLIAIVSALVAALVGVPVVTKILDSAKEPKEPDDLKLPSGLTSGSKDTTLMAHGEEATSARPSQPAKVNPDALAPEQDPFSDMDLQELAALTNSPALLQMIGMAGGLEDKQTQPAPAAQAQPKQGQAAPQPSPPASAKQAQQTQTSKPSSSKKKAKRSLVSVNWEGEWSDPPAEVPPPDEVEQHRGTPSADALFNDSDVPVITKTPANHRKKKPPPPPQERTPSSGKPDRPKKLREVAPSQNLSIGAPPAKPPLKLFVDEAPHPLAQQSPYEVIQPARQSAKAPRAKVFQSNSGVNSYGSARETHLDFQPFFALDALRVINEAREWTKGQKNRLKDVQGEELKVIINEELPEWSLLLSHVNGFLFDLAQEQLRLRRLNGAWDESAEPSLDHAKLGGVSFRQSQWQNVPTEEFIAKASAPRPKRKPRGPKRFMREG